VAALVASGAADAGIGADQGGSIRIPSSLCGVYGLKPSYGLIPYTGCIPIDVSVDYLGPIARSVENVALLLEAVAGFDDGLDPRQRADVAPVA
jgi:amidase